MGIIKPSESLNDAQYVVGGGVCVEGMLMYVLYKH